jgi:hypothetical protein
MYHGTTDFPNGEDLDLQIEGKARIRAGDEEIGYRWA